MDDPIPRSWPTAADGAPIGALGSRVGTLQGLVSAPEKATRLGEGSRRARSPGGLVVVGHARRRVGRPRRLPHPPASFIARPAAAEIRPGLPSFVDDEVFSFAQETVLPLKVVQPPPNSEGPATAARLDGTRRKGDERRAGRGHARRRHPLCGWLKKLDKLQVVYWPRVCTLQHCRRQKNVESLSEVAGLPSQAVATQS